MVAAISVTGALFVSINYKETDRTHPDSEYIKKVVTTVREFAGCEVPIEFSSERLRWNCLSIG